MPKEDKYYRALSALNDDDLDFLYKLIPALKDQDLELQTKVQELAEIIITRTELPLSKVENCYCSSIRIQNFEFDKNHKWCTTPYYGLKQSKKVSRYFPTYDKQGTRLKIHGVNITNSFDEDVAHYVIENYINKIEKGNKLNAEKLLFKLNDNRGLLFAQYMYKGIYALVTGNLYAIVESRAFITSMFIDNVQDDFCNFERLSILINKFIKYSTRECHKAGDFIGHVLQNIRAKKIKLSEVIGISRDKRASDNRILLEWQIIYDFFKPYKDIYKDLEELQKHFEYQYEKDYNYYLNAPNYISIVEEPFFDNYICNNYCENYVDFISFITTQEQFYSDELPFIDDDIKQKLINDYRKLYFDNIDLFSHDFISSNQFVESFNTVATCLFEFVFNKDIERFFN